MDQAAVTQHSQPGREGKLVCEGVMREAGKHKMWALLQSQLITRDRNLIQCEIGCFHAL